MSISDVNVVIPDDGLPHVIVPFPLYITVHLGAPDEDALNVTEPYLDYIKNVASSELYPTWPEEALKANIHAITSIAMNRIFTEWYRSRGYDFDITNTTQYDQAYVHERGIFDRISNIANEIFNQYITRTGHIEPMFAAFCDGRITQCSGMFQWGSVDLANQGYTAEEILKYYYGDDIAIIESTTPELITETYPGLPLSLGDSGIDVFRMQHSLNVISNEFPLIPKIAITGYFGEETENAVRIFQEVFNLPVTGIVDSETWYRIRFIYIAVANLAELISGGLTYEELQELYSGIVLQGASLPIVAYIEFFIDLISQRYDEIEPVVIDTFYGPDTAEAIRNFQLIMGVTPTGIVNQETLNLLYREAYIILMSTPLEEIKLPPLPFMGMEVSENMGIEYPKILILEIMLNTLSRLHPEIIPVEVDGIFNPDTSAAVIAFQSLYGLPVTGSVDAETWNKLNEVYQVFISKNEST
jgi:peptidoglycan hydrolase-like protein with peptidoglycan-binding domain